MAKKSQQSEFVHIMVFIFIRSAGVGAICIALGSESRKPKDQVKNRAKPTEEYWQPDSHFSRFNRIISAHCIGCVINGIKLAMTIDEIASQAMVLSGKTKAVSFDKYPIPTTTTVPLYSIDN